MNVKLCNGDRVQIEKNGKIHDILSHELNICAKDGGCIELESRGEFYLEFRSESTDEIWMELQDISAMIQYNERVDLALAKLIVDKLLNGAIIPDIIKSNFDL